MATPAATVAEYCTLLAKSKLLRPEEVESQYRQWQEEKPGGDDRVDSFRRFLVARRCLTEYQAALVQRGRADGFFLGGYKILDRVGKGQMGGVYKAVHGLGQVVALKILPASRAKNPQVLGRFQREARLLTQLDHPNVVRAYQVGEGGGVHFIAMEYLEGETLAEVLERRKRLPWAEAVRLAAQVLDGLQHLHEKRTVHRDLKPANVMLVPAAGKPDTTLQSTAKVLDVGLGRELFDEAPEGQADTQLTQEGSVLGTPDYLAPEQAKDARSADIRADLYSLGCALYECVAGRTPFPEKNIMAQMLKHATERPAPLSAFASDLPGGLQPVLDRLLAKSPADRYQTPAEAADALRALARGGPPAAPKPAPGFRDWLASESAPVTPDAPTLPTPALGSGSAPAPALGAAKPAPARPAAAKPGTAPAPALKSGSAPRPALLPPAPAMPRPGAAPAPYPVPAYAPFPAVEEVDVELVTLPPAAADRPLWSPSRRDWLMLAAGAASVLSAVGAGYGLARAARALTRKPDATDG